MDDLLSAAMIAKRPAAPGFIPGNLHPPSGTNPDATTQPSGGFAQSTSEFQRVRKKGPAALRGLFHVCEVNTLSFLYKTSPELTHQPLDSTRVGYRDPDCGSLHPGSRALVRDQNALLRQAFRTVVR